MSSPYLGESGDEWVDDDALFDGGDEQQVDLMNLTEEQLDDLIAARGGGLGVRPEDPRRIGDNRPTAEQVALAERVEANIRQHYDSLGLKQAEPVSPFDRMTSAQFQALLAERDGLTPEGAGGPGVSDEELRTAYQTFHEDRAPRPEPVIQPYAQDWDEGL